MSPAKVVLVAAPGAERRDRRARRHPVAHPRRLRPLQAGHRRPPPGAGTYDVRGHRQAAARTGRASWSPATRTGQSDGVLVARTVAEALEHRRRTCDDDVNVGGGALVYVDAMPLADRPDPHRGARRARRGTRTTRRSTRPSGWRAGARSTSRTTRRTRSAGWPGHAECGVGALAPTVLRMDLRVFTEPQQGATYDQLLRVARAAEDLGFGAFFRSDHYLRWASTALPGPTDAWTTLAGLARETSTIRLGTLMTSATFRHPGPLAIQVAQVDQMSGGRVELGLGRRLVRGRSTRPTASRSREPASGSTGSRSSWRSSPGCGRRRRGSGSPTTGEHYTLDGLTGAAQAVAAAAAAGDRSAGRASGVRRRSRPATPTSSTCRSSRRR